MAVTTVATALPSVVPQNPYLGGVGQVRGEGVNVKLSNLPTSTAPFFYGNNAGVTAANGKAVAAGSSDSFDVNDLAKVFVVSAANATSTASWAVTNK
jgi:hypothetical protein